MKRTLVSGLGFLLVLPAFAGARLPAVNTSGAAVSAREQYGLTTVSTRSARPVSVVASRVADSVHPVTDKKRVVARTATTQNFANDVNTRSAVMADYLLPNRPSSDLWAKKSDCVKKQEELKQQIKEYQDEINNVRNDLRKEESLLFKPHKVVLDE